MVIKGKFIDGCGFIEARLVSKSLQIDRKVTFLVDTGASRTTLLDNDARRLGIRYDKLSKSRSSLIGVGGTVACFTITDAFLIFMSLKKEVRIRLPLSVAKHPLERMAPRLRTHILRLPSLLGRDVINRYKLTFDFPNNTMNLRNFPGKAGFSKVAQVSKKIKGGLGHKTIDQIIDR